MQWLGQKTNALFVQMPEEMQADFALDSANKNNRNFLLLSCWSVFTELIYHIFCFGQSPGMPYERLFAALSIIYIALNAVFAMLFFRLKKGVTSPARVRSSHHLLCAFLAFYVIFQALGGVHEAVLFDSIYRFLAAFFVVAFVPLLPRHEKVGLLALAIVAMEIGLSVVVGHNHGYADRYRVITLLFSFVGFLIAIISQNTAMRTFALQQKLVNTNKQLSEVNHELERMAVTDSLTLIANRRAFDRYLPKAWSACCRDGSYLSVMMIDIDNFKYYNDYYGHQMGDTCLFQVAQCISSFFCRETDMVARYGGEEFVALTIKNSPGDALVLAEKVRAGVQSLLIPHEGGNVEVYVTISIGLASIAGNKDMHHSDIIKLADDALYRAKQAGKNRVEVDRSPVGAYFAHEPAALLRVPVRPQRAKAPRSFGAGASHRPD